MAGSTGRMMPARSSSSSGYAADGSGFRVEPAVRWDGPVGFPGDVQLPAGSGDGQSHAAAVVAAGEQVPGLERVRIPAVSGVGVPGSAACGEQVAAFPVEPRRIQSPPCPPVDLEADAVSP